jgi:hypothetical protein
MSPICYSCVIISDLFAASLFPVSCRYADRAKQIKTKAVVNESETEKLIRTLKEENDRLRKQLESGGVVVEKQGLTKEEIEAMRKQMEEEVCICLYCSTDLISSMGYS